MRSRPHLLLTRAPGRNGELRAVLADRAELTELPLITFEGLSHDLPNGLDRVVITSATVLQFLDLDALRDVPVAVVGPRTQRACVAAGLRVDVVPEPALASALLGALGAAGALRGQRLLYPRAEEVSPELELGLRLGGADLTSVAVYRTICPAGARAALKQLGPVDAVLLASGSAANHLHQIGGGRLPVFCIGPSTEKVARELGFEVLGVAQVHTSLGLARCVLESTVF
ncbi:MAG: uroporphyrinogen-III synthase [Cognaticolwellia sp.]|jgi:uroporphyrinogen-III synthase